MADNGVSLDWGGLDKAIARAAQKFADRKTLLAAIGEALISGTQDRFMDEQDPEGKKWQPSGRAWEDGLAKKGRKATKNRKAVKGHRETGKFGQTLADTGRLLKSIDKAVTNDAVMVGSNVAYARIHQLGGQTGRGHKVTMPKRSYLGLSEEDAEEVKGLLEDYIAKSFRS